MPKAHSSLSQTLVSGAVLAAGKAVECLSARETRPSDQLEPPQQKGKGTRPSRLWLAAGGLSTLLAAYGAHGLTTEAVRMVDELLTPDPKACEFGTMPENYQAALDETHAFWQAQSKNLQHIPAAYIPDIPEEGCLGPANELVHAPMYLYDSEMVVLSDMPHVQSAAEPQYVVLHEYSHVEQHTQPDLFIIEPLYLEWQADCWVGAWGAQPGGFSVGALAKMAAQIGNPPEWPVSWLTHGYDDQRRAALQYGGAGGDCTDLVALGNHVWENTPDDQG